MALATPLFFPEGGYCDILLFLAAYVKSRNG